MAERVNGSQEPSVADAGAGLPEGAKSTAKAASSASRVKEILRFVITGGVCFVVEFAILVLLKSVLHVDTLIATPIAFLVSVAVNYLLCVAWVFEDTKNQGGATKIGFFVTSAMGLLFNELLMLLFRVLFGEETVLFTVFGFSFSMYMLNKVLATLLVMVWNYFTKRAMLRSAAWRKRFGKS